MKQLNFDDLNIFVSVVQTRSFTDAARQLGIPKSRVSRVISTLEASYSGQLFYRTTREVNLTDLGQRLYALTLPGIQSLRDSLRLAQRNESKMTGNITITAVEDIGTVILTPIIAQLAERHPSLTFNLIFSLDVLDLVKHGIDIAIRAGSTKQQSYRARRLGDMQFTLVGSPRYLEQFPDHEKPECLHQMDLIAWHRGAFATQKIRLFKGSMTAEIDRPAKFRVTNSDAMLTLALAGRGVANLPRFMCESHLQDQSLREICPNWHQITRPISIVTPAKRRLSPVVDKVSAYLADALEQALRR
jgi:LysR family transcriptional regulator for bpeEF and oprC